MAGRLSPAPSFAFFNRDETALSEVFFEGSDDELGMENEEEDGSVANFERCQIKVKERNTYSYSHACIATLDL